MGCDRAEATISTISSSPSSSGSVGDELLYATMCMVGLPVHVHVKDGSVYSGIFHTACFQRDYGVVLKKAKKEKKGKARANLVEGAIVDTLVILSEDIVQVVAKGVQFPVDTFVENGADSDLGTVTGSILSQAGHGGVGREQKELKSSKATSKWIAAEGTPEINQNRNLDPAAESVSSHGVTKTDIDDVVLTVAPPKPFESIVEAENRKMESTCGAEVKVESNVPIVSSAERQVGKEKPQLEEDGLNAHKGGHIVSEFHSSSSSMNCPLHPNIVDGRTVEISANGAGFVNLVTPLVTSEALDGVFLSSTVIQSSDVAASNASTSAVDIISAPSSGPLNLKTLFAPKKSGSATSSKEFKLNPGAKTFAPSFAHPMTASPPASSIGTVGLVPNSPPAVPVGGVHSGIEISPFAPRPSLPVKFVQYNNLMSGNSGSSQYSLPMVGHFGLGGRQQPVRYGGQFQTGPAYVHPNPQTVMVGRMGQVVYVHPITHDPLHGTAITQVPTRPLPTPHQAHLPKHQGTAGQTLQLCVAPVVQQPCPVASYIPMQQPFPAIQPVPVPVPGGNGIFNSKF